MLSGTGNETEARIESGRKAGSTLVLRDWFHFVLHPDQNPGDHSLKITIQNFFKLYYFNILAMFAIFFLVFLVQLFFKLEQIPFPSQSPAKTLLLVAALSVVEELFFRLPLRYRPFNIALPCGLILTITSAYFIKKLHIPMPAWGHYLTLTTLAILFSLLLYLFFKNTLMNGVFDRLYAKRFPIIFYLLNITFALLHFTNFRHFSSAAYLIAPIVTLPQLLTGLNLSYLRIRHGIFWAAFYHIFWNMVWFLMILNKNVVLYGLQLMAGATFFGLLLAWALPVELGRKKIIEKPVLAEDESKGTP